MDANMASQYNMRNPAVKRLMQEAVLLRHPTTEFYTQPLEDNLFEWHFTIRGPDDTDFAGGTYHGRITLPPEYPMKPPNIVFLTPNGRFEVNKKICLSMSAYHPETWCPSWGIRTILLAIIGFMPTPGAGAIGSLDCPSEDRRVLASKSGEWRCNICACPNSTLLKSQALSESPETKQSFMREAQLLASQMKMEGGSTTAIPDNAMPVLSEATPSGSSNVASSVPDPPAVAVSTEPIQTPSNHPPSPQSVSAAPHSSTPTTSDMPGHMPHPSMASQEWPYPQIHGAGTHPWSFPSYIPKFIDPASYQMLLASALSLGLPPVPPFVPAAPMMMQQPLSYLPLHAGWHPVIPRPPLINPQSAGVVSQAPSPAPSTSAANPAEPASNQPTQTHHAMAAIEEDHGLRRRGPHENSETDRQVPQQPPDSGTRNATAEIAARQRRGVPESQAPLILMWLVAVIMLLLIIRRLILDDLDEE